jgi:hypothetical protein
MWSPTRVGKTLRERLSDMTPVWRHPQPPSTAQLDRAVALLRDATLRRQQFNVCDCTRQNIEEFLQQFNTRGNT